MKLARSILITVGKNRSFSMARIILLFIFLHSCASLQIVEPVQEYISAPGLRLNVDFEIPTTHITLSIPQSACSPLENNVTGSIVAFTQAYIGNTCDIVTALLHIQEAGAVAVVLLLPGAYAGQGAQAYLVRTWPNHEKLTLNGLEVPLDSTLGRLLVDDKNEDVYVSMRPDVNHYQQMIDSGAMLGLEIVFQIFGGVTILLAAWKLVGYIRVQGVELSAPQICLALEILGTIERIIYMVDPLWIEGIYSNSTSFALLDLTYMFSLITTLLLGLYWRKSLSSLSKENMFVRVRKPLIIGVVFIMLASVLYILGSVFISAVVFFIMYNCIITPLILIFFLVSGFRILSVLRTNNVLRASKKGSLQKLTVYIISSAIVFFVFLIASIVFITTSYSGPWGFYVLVWFLFGSLYSVSFLHVLAFVNPYNKKSSSEVEATTNQNSVSMMPARHESNSIHYQDSKEV